MPFLGKGLHQSDRQSNPQILIRTPHPLTIRSESGLDCRRASGPDLTAVAELRLPPWTGRKVVEGATLNDESSARLQDFALEP